MDNLSRRLAAALASAGVETKSGYGRPTVDELTDVVLGVLSDGRAACEHRPALGLGDRYLAPCPQCQSDDGSPDGACVAATLVDAVAEAYRAAARALQTGSFVGEECCAPVDSLGLCPLRPYHVTTTNPDPEAIRQAWGERDDV